MSYYMNPYTGSVDLWENWVDDQKSMGFPIEDLSTLIEVEKNAAGDWEEKQ